MVIVNRIKSLERDPTEINNEIDNEMIMNKRDIIRCRTTFKILSISYLYSLLKE